MLPNELITKLIDLQEEANSHASEYLRLRDLRGSRLQADSHLRKADRLRSRIQDLIHEIAKSPP